MSSDPKVSPTQPPVGSAVASAQAQHSNRASPYPPTTTAASIATSAQDNTAMATTATYLPPTSHAFRPGPSGQQYPHNMPAAGHHFDRDVAQPIGTPFSNSPAPPMIRVLIRRLPLNTSEESLRLMVVWSKELVDVQLLSAEQSEDNGFRSALMRFKTMTGALEAKKMLDGRSNISNDAQMVVEILGASPVASRRHVTEPQQGAINGSSAPGPRQPSQFNGAFSHLENMPPPPNGLFSSHEFANGDGAPHYQNIFSPQSPIGNHLAERTRMSSKSLINNDFADDDETSDLLKDPVAYAESSATSQRRATAPQIPISRMANLSLNTTAASPPGPSSLPPYMNSLSPVSSGGPGMNYPMPGPAPAGPAPGQHFQRHNFPPVNPADQNPPCNTLYVGNLPIDTSEEELKAMFSKQRGYKRLCFRTKQNGPMCFVEFEDISFATKALHELYGQPLHNSVKGGIRLSFSKNPLGVRSGQAPSQAPSIPLPNANGAGMGSSPANGFPTTNGPPPGLSAPPGLGTGRAASYSNGHGGGHGPPGAGRGFPFNGFPSASNNPWNTPGFGNSVAAGPNPVMNGNSNFMPRHMMGR